MDNAPNALRTTTGASSQGISRRAWIIGVADAIWFGIPMGLVAYDNGSNAPTGAGAWYASIAVGIVLFSVVAAFWARPTVRPGDVWRITTLLTCATIVGLYIPFASSQACAALGEPGGCYSSGLSAIMAGAAPLYGAFLVPVAIALAIRRRLT